MAEGRENLGPATRASRFQECAFGSLGQKGSRGSLYAGRFNANGLIALQRGHQFI